MSGEKACVWGGCNGTRIGDGPCCRCGTRGPRDAGRVPTTETKIDAAEIARFRRVDNAAFVLMAAMRTAEKTPTEPARHHVHFQVGHLADALGVEGTIAADRAHWRDKAPDVVLPEDAERTRIADMDAAARNLLRAWDRILRDEGAHREEPAANLRVLSEIRGPMEALREAVTTYDPTDEGDLGREDGGRDVSADPGEANKPAWAADLERQWGAV